MRPLSTTWEAKQVMPLSCVAASYLNTAVHCLAPGVASGARTRMELRYSLPCGWMGLLGAVRDWR